MKKSILVCILIVVGLVVGNWFGGVHTYYSMPEGETPNGLRVMYKVECPDGNIGTCVATPYVEGNPQWGVKLSYYN